MRHFRHVELDLPDNVEPPPETAQSAEPHPRLEQKANDIYTKTHHSAARRGWSDDTAWQLAANVFVKLRRAVGRNPRIAGDDRWLEGTAMHILGRHSIDAVRAEAREANRVAELTDDLPAGAARDTLLAAELQAVYRAAIGTLSVQERRVHELRFVHGLPASVIAEELDINKRTVDRHIVNIYAHFASVGVEYRNDHPPIGFQSPVRGQESQ